eukprot:9069895-Alexandrium_andersonii.AAC.1
MNPLELTDVFHEDGDMPEIDTNEAQKPTTMREPSLPSEAEIRAHQLTHLPYRDWCVHCRRGEMVDSPHPHRAEETVDKTPLAQMDYFYGQTSHPDEEVQTFLAVVFVNFTYGMACMVTKKGSGCKYRVKSVLSFLAEGGVRQELIIQTDPESASKDLAETIAQGRPGRTV